MKNNRITPTAVTLYLPQFFVGFFFLAAAYLKWHQALLGPHRVTLSSIFEHWIANNLPVDFYRSFMTLSMPYADTLAWTVIILQAAIGLLLILNWQVRLAGALLFFVQFNVYLATYHHTELRVLGSQALWMGLYFFARPEMRGRIWRGMTYALVIIGLLHLYGRYVHFQDPSLVTAVWQRGYFAMYNMSSWPGLKRFVLAASATPAGLLLWAAAWWLKLGLLLGMLTRFRLYAGAAWLVMLLAITLVWLSTWTCEGVFWILIMFLWVTHERALQVDTPDPPRSLLP